MIFSASIEKEIYQRADGDVCEHHARQNDCLEKHINVVNACTNSKETYKYANNKQFNENHAAIYY